MQHDIDVWRGLVGAGAALLGAFGSDRLVGLALDEPSAVHLSEGVANVAVLYVTRADRSQGAGRAPSDEVVRLARADGAQRRSVSVVPTRATVVFYGRQCFAPFATPDEEVFALEPDGIHMERRL